MIRQAPEHGLLLVGDEGIYLMSCGNPQPEGDDGDSLVAFAEGLNPEADSEWLYNKKISWGKTNGLMLLPLRPIEIALEGRARYLRIILTPSDYPKLVNGVKKGRRIQLVRPLHSTRTREQRLKPRIPTARKQKTGDKTWRGYRISQSK